MRRSAAAAPSRSHLSALAGLGLTLVVLACAAPRPRALVPEVLEDRAPEEYAWLLPAGFPEPLVPADNPMSAVKVELGRFLFYDRRLSGNGHFACSTCHRQELAFTDGLPRAVGSTGEEHPRGSMSLTNVAYNATYNWADPERTRLEDQALNPILNESPIELGIAGREAEMLERLAEDPSLSALFERAFPGEPLSLDTVVRALAAFERTLISGNSPYDRYIFWDEPLGDAELRGMELFLSERTHCSECHAGLNLSGPVRTRESASGGMTGRSGGPVSGMFESEFHNTGLFDLDGAGAYPEPNRGVFEITGRAEDMGRFRAPTLRNIAVTAPYMHDGSLATLEEVIRFYAAGGRGPGRTSPLKSALVAGFELAIQEEADLLAFLRALTDRSFLADPRFADPRPSD